MKARALLLAILVLAASSAAFAQGYDALVREAEAKLAAKQWAEAVALYEKAFATGEFSLDAYYNAACASALLGKKDDAFAYLGKAIDAGLLEKESLEEDKDLESLRTDERWKGLLDALSAKLAALERAIPENRPDGPAVELPAPRLAGRVSVEEALKNRRSIRTYLDKPLTLEEVSQLLWSAYGITMTREKMPAFLRGGLRTAPSAGARFPLDIYLAAFNVAGLPAGIYWYDSEKHRLVRLIEGDRRSEVSAASFDQPQFKTAAAAIAYSAVYERTTSKYGERGRERYVCMDLGHSAENVYLQAYALKIGTCAIGAFSDIAMKLAFKMTRPEEPLYLMPVGKVE